MRWSLPLEPTMQQWNLRRLVAPLGQQYGCQAGQTQRRLYRIACRGTGPNTGMRQGPEPASWTQFNATGGSGTLLDVHLAPADEASLSQLWFIDQVDGDLSLFRNYALGEDWPLSPDAVLRNNEKLAWKARKDPMAHMRREQE